MLASALTAMLLRLDGFGRYNGISPHEIANIWGKLKDWEEGWKFLDLCHDINFGVDRSYRNKTAPDMRVIGWQSLLQL